MLATDLPETGTLIGHSLALCIHDVLDHGVDDARISKIVAETFYTDRDMFLTGLQMSFSHNRWKSDPKRGIAIAMRLWDAGLIEQPRRRGNLHTPLPHGHWSLA